MPCSSVFQDLGEKGNENRFDRSTLGELQHALANATYHVRFNTGLLIFASLVVILTIASILDTENSLWILPLALVFFGVTGWGARWEHRCYVRKKAELEQLMVKLQEEPEKRLALIMDLKERLKDLGLELPEVSKPGGNYQSVNVRSDIAYVAIQFPIKNDAYFYQGRLGKTLDTEDGKSAMSLCALNVISQIESKVGFDKILGLNHIEAYYQAANDWDDGPKVVDAASDLFLKALGSKGEHSRAIYGVERLPRDFCVGLTVTATLDQNFKSA